MAKEIKDADVMSLIDALNDYRDNHGPKLLYGTIVSQNRVKYVMLDGGDTLTPISESNECLTGDRVTVQIVNHEAIITGNITSPASARTATAFIEKDKDGNIIFGDMKNGYVDGVHWAIRNGVFELIGPDGESMSKFNANSQDMTVFGISIKDMTTVVDNIAEDYVTSIELSSSIEQTETSIIDKVSASYTLKAELDNAVVTLNNGIDAKLESYVTTVEMGTELKRTADEINLHAEKTYTTQATFNALEIGGRNLFLKTGVPSTNNYYGVASYFPASGPLVAGETYTVTICVTPGAGTSHYGTYFSTGYVDVASLVPSGTGKQIISKTFVMAYHTGREPSNSASHATLMIYKFPNNSSITTTIHWIKIEKGNKATDWTPAPEDLESDVSALATRISTAETNITTNANAINLRATKTDIETLEIGGGNLFKDTIKEYTNNSYLMATYAPVDQPLITGNTYTVTVCVTPGNGTTSVGLYFSQGGALEASLPVSGTHKQVVSKTFTCSYASDRIPSNNILNAYAYIYRFPNNSSITSTLHWIKVEAGNVATGGIETRVSKAEAEIVVNADSISSKVSKTDFNGEKMISLINQDASSVTINANKINLTGNVTITSMNTAITNAQNSANSSNTIANLALMMTNGKLLYTDPTFLSSWNNVSTYNNANNGNVDVNRVTKAGVGMTSCPTTSSYMIRIITKGTATPGLGGFVQRMNSRANAVFITKYLIWLPAGYKLHTAANSIGTGSSDTFVGGVEGTGTWKEYYRLTQCGSSGSFSSFGHVYVESGSIPVTWYLGGIWAYDVTDVSGYALQTSLDTTNTNVTNAAKAASSAQSTADTAKTNAATAQSTANDALASANNSLKRYKATIDLSSSSYNTNTYYPVYQIIPKEGFHECEVAVQLDSNKPSWSTHASGFTCNLKTTVLSGGWGTTEGTGWISASSYRYCDKMPAYVRQFTNSSMIAFFLRGGGKYYLYSDISTTWDIITSSTTVSSQTVAPTTTPSNGYTYAPLQSIGAWCAANNTTMIDGGKIYTGSIKAASIDVDNLFAQTVTATNMTVNGNSKIGLFSISGASLIRKVTSGSDESTIELISGANASNTVSEPIIDLRYYATGAKYSAWLKSYDLQFIKTIGTVVTTMGVDALNDQIYAPKFVEGGTSLSDKYAPKSHTHSYNPVISVTSNGAGIGTDNAAVAPGSWVSKGSFTLSAGTWLIIVTMRWANASVGWRGIKIGNSSGDNAADVSSMDSKPAVNGDYTYNRITVVYAPTASKTYYVNQKQTNSSTVASTCRLTAIKLK